MAKFHFEILDQKRRIAGDSLQEDDPAAAFTAATVALAIFTYQRPALRERLSIILRDEAGCIVSQVSRPGSRQLCVAPQPIPMSKIRARETSARFMTDRAACGDGAKADVLVG